MGGDFLSFSKVTEVSAPGGAHFTSPLKTVDFLEAYPGILGQKFMGSSKADWLDSAGTNLVSSTAVCLSTGWGTEAHRLGLTVHGDGCFSVFSVWVIFAGFP